MTTVAFWHRVWAVGLVLPVVYIALGFALDFVAYSLAGNAATFSRWFRALSREWLIIPAALGAFLAGVVVHWYGLMRQPLEELPAADLLAELDRRRSELDRPATTVIVHAEPGATTNIAVPDDSPIGESRPS